MVLSNSTSRSPISRRSFFKASLGAVGGLALYSGEIERHMLEVTRHEIALPGLPAVFDGTRIAQITDIHLDGFTEPFFLRQSVDRVNQMQPDAVLLTGDYACDGIGSKELAVGAAWQCANILRGIHCQQVYAVLGNHDVAVGEREVAEALRSNGINVLRNEYLPMERTGGRFWLAGLDDPVWGKPDPDRAIPASIRNQPNEPIVLMCHAPDYADTLLRHPAGPAIRLMLCGHTHGGQVRLPFVGALALPELGKKYVEGWFRLGDLQLYVNRGLGTVGLPFRLNCPPEIAMITLRSVERKASA